MVIGVGSGQESSNLIASLTLKWKETYKPSADLVLQLDFLLYKKSSGHKDKLAHRTIPMVKLPAKKANEVIDFISPELQLFPSLRLPNDDYFIHLVTRPAVPSLDGEGPVAWDFCFKVAGKPY